MNWADAIAEAEAIVARGQHPPTPVRRTAWVKHLEARVADLDFDLERSIDREREADASVRELTTELEQADELVAWWVNVAAYGWVAAGVFFVLFVVAVLVG